MYLQIKLLYNIVYIRTLERKIIFRLLCMHLSMIIQPLLNITVRLRVFNPAQRRFIPTEEFSTFVHKSREPNFKARTFFSHFQNLT